MFQSLIGRSFNLHGEMKSRLSPSDKFQSLIGRSFNLHTKSAASSPQTDRFQSLIGRSFNLHLKNENWNAKYASVSIPNRAIVQFTLKSSVDEVSRCIPFQSLIGRSFNLHRGATEFWERSIRFNP